MAVALVAVTTALGALTGNKPTGTLQDHLLLAQITGYDATAQTGPSGWTKLLDQLNNASNLRIDIWYKVAGASEPASYTWSGPANADVGISTWSGVNTTTPINVSASQANTSSTSATCGTITTTVDDCMDVLFCQEDALVTGTPPSGYTEEWEYDANQMAHKLLGAAGATGSRVYSLSGASANIGQSVAIAPPASTSLPPGLGPDIAMHQPIQSSGAMLRY